MDKKILDKQAQHWENTFITRPETFGVTPSAAAIKAAKTFNKEGITNILELGAGQGRDALFFAQKGFHIQVLDYSQTGVDKIIKKAKTLGVDKLITGKIHDVRNPFPFTNEKFGGCFSHMLYCMALTTKELQFLSDEILRVLKNGGVNIYTVRHTGMVIIKMEYIEEKIYMKTMDLLSIFFQKKKLSSCQMGLIL